MTRILTIALCALSISVPAFAHSAPGEAKIYPTRPVGNGNPSSISCYLEKKPLSHIARKVCKPNAEWARIQMGINENFPGN
jgi:hypothetical protein